MRPDSGVNTVGANGEGKVRVCEVDATLAFSQRRNRYTRTGDTVQVSALRQQVPLRPRVLYRPSLPAVKTSGQHRNLRLLAIDMVILTLVLVVAHPETDQDFVPPAPDAMIGGPPAEHPLLKVDRDMPGFVDRHLLLVRQIRFHPMWKQADHFRTASSHMTRKTLNFIRFFASGQALGK